MKSDSMGIIESDPIVIAVESSIIVGNYCSAKRQECRDRDREGGVQFCLAGIRSKSGGMGDGDLPRGGRGHEDDTRTIRGRGRIME